MFSKNRFFSTADDFGRDGTIVKQSLEKVAPTLFNEEERTPSKITEALQQNLPRIFTDEDEDEDDTILKQSLEKFIPELFNEEERVPSKITEALQENLPRIFTEDGGNSG